MLGLIIYGIGVSIGLGFIVYNDVIDAKNNSHTDEEARVFSFLATVFWPFTLVILLMIVVTITLGILYRNFINLLARKPLDFSL